MSKRKNRTRRKGNVMAGIGIASLVVLGAGAIACAVPQSRNAILDGLAPHSEIYKEITAENADLTAENTDLITEKETIKVRYTNLESEKQALEERYNALNSKYAGVNLTCTPKFILYNGYMESIGFGRIEHGALTSFDGASLNAFLNDVKNDNINWSGGCYVQNVDEYLLEITEETEYNNTSEYVYFEKGHSMFSPDRVVDVKVKVFGEEKADFVIDNNVSYYAVCELNIEETDGLINNLEIVINLQNPTGSIALGDSFITSVEYSTDNFETSSSEHSSITGDIWVDLDLKLLLTSRIETEQEISIKFTTSLGETYIGTSTTEEFTIELVSE